MPSSKPDPADPDTIVRRFVDGELSEDELEDALHEIADDPEARSLLQFEVKMTQGLAASRITSPSPEFAERTMERAVARSTAAPMTAVARWWTSLTTPPFTVPARPISVLAALLLVAAVLWVAVPAGIPDAEQNVASGSNASRVQTASATAPDEPATVWTRFLYVADDAESVAVAGDFSQWEPIPLTARTVNGRTVWSGLVSVQRGEHEYQFVINGERWVTDPLAPVKHDDGFGAKNAVLKL